ncbi:MAG TPA: nuclear transport factor 2 family protein [Chloroflexota bacterium]|jgi:ketosteroid isomerase-like protein|nr:nuclear transport factor 2 family protein [Chloroflexota bacterium]
MIRNIVPAVAFFLMLLPAAAAQAPARKLPQTAPARPAADARTAITAAYHRLEQAIVARDLDAFMRPFWHSPTLVVFDVVPPLQYTGWEAVRKDASEFFASLAGPITFEIRDLHIETDGTMAYARYLAHVAGRDARTGQPVDQLLRVSDVWRQRDGRWVIVHEHASVPVDLETGKAIWHAQP